MDRAISIARREILTDSQKLFQKKKAPLRRCKSKSHRFTITIGGVSP
jgi:hypothetical protein